MLDCLIVSCVMLRCKQGKELLICLSKDYNNIFKITSGCTTPCERLHGCALVLSSTSSSHSQVVYIASVITVWFAVRSDLLLMLYSEESSIQLNIHRYQVNVEFV